MRSQTDTRVRAIQRGRITVQSSAVVLAIVLAFNSASPAMHAQEPPEKDRVESADQKKVAKVKAEVIRRGVGHNARVRVKLRGKHELHGHITQIDQDSFQMLVDQGGLDEQSALDRLITIRYAEVEKVRGPRSPAANVVIGVGLGVVLVAVLAVIVVAEVYKHNHRY
jgi:hypothetical protein